MRTTNVSFFLLMNIFLLIGITNINAQTDLEERIFNIDKCVNQFDKNKKEKTKVGYQYWFADKEFLDGRTLKMSVVAPGEATHPPHSHNEDEFFFVLEGKAEFFLNGERRIANAYSSFYCPPNSEHGIKNVGDTELKYLL